MEDCQFGQLKPISYPANLMDSIPGFNAVNSSGKFGTQTRKTSLAEDGHWLTPDAHPGQIPRSVAGSLQVRLFDGLAESDRDLILAASSFRRYSADSIVLSQQERAERMCLLIEGSARHFFITPEGRKVYLLWLSPGQVFGASCLLSKPARFLVSTEVQRNSSVIIWKRNTIRTLATRHTQLLENALEIANEYLTWYLATHLSLVSQTARQRLANVLVSLARGIGSRHSDGIHLHVTNEDLANTANITLFTASRLLNEWQRGGALNKSRGKVVLLSPERLFVA